MPSSVEQLLNRLESSARDTGWMHLDAGGSVRVGAGLLLPDAETAEHLPFQLGIRAATRTEIAAEFRRVKALPPQLPAEFYRREHGPELEPEMVGALLRTSLVGLQVQLRDWLPHFDQLGLQTQMALLSAGCKTGAREALSQYPRLIEPAARSQPASVSVPASVSAAVQRSFTPRAQARGISPHNLAFGLVGFGAAMLEWLQKPRTSRRSA